MNRKKPAGHSPLASLAASPPPERRTARTRHSFAPPTANRLLFNATKVRTEARGKTFNGTTYLKCLFGPFGLKPTYDKDGFSPQRGLSPPPVTSSRNDKGSVPLHSPSSHRLSCHRRSHFRGSRRAQRNTAISLATPFLTASPPAAEKTARRTAKARPVSVSKSYGGFQASARTRGDDQPSAFRRPRSSRGAPRRAGRDARRRTGSPSAAPRTSPSPSPCRSRRTRSS